MPRTLNKTCPVCGVPVDDRAKYCGKHRAFDRIKPQGYVCPICGGPKSRIESKVCAKCYDPSTNKSYKSGWQSAATSTPSLNPESISSEWMYQFVGLFYSEGTAVIHKTNHQSFHAYLGIGLRADDEDALRDVQGKLGGTLRYEPRSVSPMYRWNVSKAHQVKPICEMILQHTLIPLKKARDVEIVLKFVTWRLEQPYHQVDWSVGQQLAQELRSIRVFKLQG